VEQGDAVGTGNEYESTFAAIDTDEDGLITAWELKELMRGLGRTLDDDAAATMLGFMDADGDGKVTLDELTAYLSKA
jgi:Ca2+-binding EF-hand superfamily protein